MTIRERLDAAIDSRRLLDHPFYVEWRAGTLPKEAIATYAAEYGGFIRQIADGWEMVGEADHATEERHHAELWEQFADRLGTKVRSPEIPEVSELLDTASRLFSDPASAWGALYAFESQQPGTSGEKLGGLVEHYEFDPDGPATEYFRVHAGDYHEADSILESLVDADSAVAACGEMADALYKALDGVLAAA